jgi:outer membrane murein-binding lipoprotein Lpp
MRKATLLVTVAVLALAVPATAAAPPEVVKLRKQVAALNAKVKRLTVERNSARREVVALKARLTPQPTGSVTLANGENGDRARVTGAGVTTRGNILGQLEYLGGPTCEEFGPWVTVQATFFDANGTIVETGGHTESSPVTGARYPLEIFGVAGAVRADAVVSVTCL